MLLTISTNHSPATDLGYLLHKHPDRLQEVALSSGKAQIFYPEASEDKCTVALLLDIDPISLVRNARNTASESFTLGHYVNDRPYVASSLMSVAIAKAFSTAMNGTCANRPEAVDKVMPFEVNLSALPAPKGGELLIRKLFEPLGYEVRVERHSLDKNFPEWGESKYYHLKLTGQTRLQDLLSHLYVLIPVLDNDKHYWVSEDEVNKLLKKGEGWLRNHPEKEQITKRYLLNIGRFTKSALGQLLAEDSVADEEETEEDDTVIKRKETLHQERLKQVLSELKASGAKSVLDLGCGEGKLLKMLLREKQFENILGMDISYRSLEKAKERLHFQEMAPRQKERINLIHGALTYRDKRLEGFDAAALVEVIEHLDENRLAALERVLFEFARPTTVVLTTPNRDYNQLFETLDAGAFRHSDHRFEWSRAEFKAWATGVAEVYDYTVNFKAVGEEHPNFGAPSQMAIFNLK
ncbi:3' terminal RNA ribose 2'-O-methyltransferase Hen1 [Porifericola rhodea]|uniref:3' terminal RNA ribose 2'-O-methyltransferase Hen1 n=1 Tax=Porifericola rhodea TaxID=930972 RepID=UPI00266651CC|nr:3' terminal RNA ribose 2'-O-methyltransferase Hen1 [Porifericola rhodea]WKN33789.1 3' terminal RNA ribose 2'-O-methyltransferase Hen1 [Porifericola rhodea]